MAQAVRLKLRMQKELKLLLADPPHGASFPFLATDSDLSDLTSIDARIEGPEGTVYANGIFKIKIQIPERYPLQPPMVTFGTPIYHPNIDNGGRICLDILNLPPKGAWQPSLNISTVLTSIRLLLSEPNPDDGLMCEASKEYKYNRQAFDHKARSMTEKFAKVGAGESSCTNQSPETNTETKMVHGLDLESKHGAVEFIPGHEKPRGISRRLSLESTSPNKKKDSNIEVKEVPKPHLLLSDVNIQMEGKRKREKEIDALNECNLNHEQVKKSALKSSNQLEDDFDNKENVDPNNLSSLCQHRASSGSSPPQASGSQQLDQHQEGKSSNTSISRRLSLEPTSSNKKKDSDIEVKEVPKPRLLLSNVKNQMEGKRKREKETDVLNECNLNHEKVNGNRKKSALKSSNHIVDDFDNKENVDPNYLSSLCQHQSSSGSSPPQASGSQQLDQHRDDKSASSSIKSSSMHCQRQKQPFGLTDSLQTCENVKMLGPPQDESISGSANTKPGKLSSVGTKKLSLGLKRSSNRQQDSNKENNKMNAIHNSPLSKQPQSPRKSGLGRKLSLGLGPLTRVQQDSEHNKKQQCHQGQSMGIDVDIKKQKGIEESKESSMEETVIVLDSESSEEEGHGAMRSKAPVARRRLGKWRVKLER